MSPLELWIRNPRVPENGKDEDKWIKYAEVRPGDSPGTLSHNQGTRRDIIIFRCANDDSHSTITRSEPGIDTVNRKDRAVFIFGTEIPLADLKDGEHFDMDIKTDVSPKPRKVRFVHKREKRRMH